MIQHFKNYYWKEGRPYGIEPTNENHYYRIVTDPYHKRYSVEEYEKSKFKRIIYDSNLFDFRALKDPRQASWLKESLSNTESLLRNQDDRVVLIEKYTFASDRPRYCHYYIPQGLLVAHHKVFYKDVGDAFDGVILYDTSDRPVMQKSYKVEDEEFTELIEEKWNFS